MRRVRSANPLNIHERRALRQRDHAPERGFTTWELLRGSNVVCNLHFMAPLSLLAEAMELDSFRPTPSGVLLVATTPSSTSKADWSALLERPVVSKLCSAAMLLPCAATWPSVVARAAAVAGGAIAGASALLSSFEASSAVTRASRDWMAAALLPDAAVFTARSVTCAHLSVVQDLRDVARDRSFKHVYICSRRLSPVAIPQSAGSAASVLEWHSTPPHRRHRLLVRQPHQPLFGTSFRKYVSQSVGDLESEARTRPAPGPHQARTRVFSEVARLQCDSLDLTLDLTDGAGQKRDLRTMEPVSDIIGHCFVVGD